MRVPLAPTYFAILMAVLFLGACAGIKREQSRPDWKEFVSTDEKFRVLFPKEPKRLTAQTINEVGPKVESIRYETVLGQVNYVVFYADFSKIEILQNDPGISYELIRNNLAQQMKAEVLREKEIRVGGLIGREFAMSKENDLILMRLVWNKKEQYQLITSTSLTDKHFSEFEGLSQKFFESFKIDN